MTLNFDPVTLTFDLEILWQVGYIMWAIYIPNSTEIDQSVAETLIINDRFFVRFRGCSKLSIGDLKNSWTDLHQICWGH